MSQAPVHPSVPPIHVDAEVHEVGLNGNHAAFARAGDFAFLVYGEATLRDHIGEVVQAKAEALARALPILLSKRFKTFFALEDGKARAEFEDGSSLEAQPGSQFEEWQFEGKNGVLIIGTPGAEIASWRPRPSP